MPNPFSVRRAVSLALLSAGLALTRGPLASAEDASAAEEPTETVIITGSRIRRLETETPVPLQVLTRDNVFNKMTPFDPYTYGGLNYNPTFYQSGAVGRFMTVGANYRF